MEKCTCCEQYRDVTEIACIIIPIDDDMDNLYIYACAECLRKALAQLEGQ